MIEMARGLAALAVVIFHANASSRFYGAPNFPWLRPFEYGVDFFFVLSGFVVMLAHRHDIGRPRQIIPYLTKRTIRLFPILWLVVLGVFALRVAAGAPSDIETLVRSLIPFPSLEQTLPQVIWTLRHELLFYAIFAVLILSRVLGTLVMAIWMVLVELQLYAALFASPVDGLTAFFLSTYHLDFVFGMALALINGKQKPSRSPILFLLGLTALLIFLAMRDDLGLSRLSQNDYVSPGATLGVFLTGALFAFIVHGLIKLEGIRIWRPFVALGSASYVLYLVHTPVNSLVQRGVVRLPPELLEYGVGHALLVVSGVVASFAIHYAVERPLLVRLRRFLLPRNGQAVIEASAIAPDNITREAYGTSVPNMPVAITGDVLEEETVGWFSRIFRKNRYQSDEVVEGAEPLDEAEAERRMNSRLRDVPSRYAHSKNARSKFPQFAAVDRGALGERAGMARLGTAFTPSHPISDPELFAGRRDLISRLIELIELQGLHVVLFGDRGIGKTSILRIVSDLAERANYRVVYGSCGSDTNFDSLMRSLARNVPLLYHRDYGATHPRVEEGQTFADELGEQPVTVAEMTGSLERLDGTRLLMVIDEFDRVESERMREQLAELIKNLSDRNVTIQFLIAGVSSNLNSLISHIPSIRRNLTGLQVNPLSADEVEEILGNGALKSGIKFDDPAAQMLVAHSQGLPYLAHLLALHAGVAAVQDGRSVVTAADIAKATRLAAGELRLRVSPKGIRAASGAGSKVGWEALGRIARTAMQDVGIVTDADVASLDSATKLSLFERSAEHAAAVDAGEWQFVEEALAPYIWLSSLDAGSSQTADIELVRPEFPLNARSGE
jgi:peptidoglycan/LPS O-acetylase OafA/YrhL/Cdc6-like AAA superfamily ATPase